MARTVVTDEIHNHLRKQDEDIAAIREQNEAMHTELRAELAPVIYVAHNLRGFSEFCSRWGGRISRLLKWLALVGPALTLLWQWLSGPIGEIFKSKGAG